jgi:putative membrane protein
MDNMDNGRAKRFFTTEEQQRIIEAVRAAEGRTSGEIVPMVVSAASDYSRAEIVGGGLFALAIGVLISWYFGHSSVWIFLVAFLLLYFPCKLLVRHWPALKLKLLHPAEIDVAVEEKCMVAFLERGLHYTQDETGILILISLLEHRVHVLADRGINRLVPRSAWEEIVTLVTEGIRGGQACSALCEAIESCGDLLAESFPPRDADRDELPNLILD